MRLALIVIGSTIASIILMPMASSGQQLKPPETPEYKLPVSMLATDEFAFISAVSAVESPAKRADKAGALRRVTRQTSNVDQLA